MQIHSTLVNENGEELKTIYRDGDSFEEVSGIEASDSVEHATIREIREEAIRYFDWCVRKGVPSIVT